MVETMFKLSGQRVEICIGIGGERKHLTDTWVGRGRVKLSQVNDTRQVMTGATLITHRQYPVFRQTVLHLHRIKIDIRNRHIDRVGIDVGWNVGSSGHHDGQTICSQARGQDRIPRIAQWIVARARVEKNLTADERVSRSPATDSVAGYIRRVVAGVVEDVVIEAVISDAETAAKDEIVVILCRTPGKTHARAKMLPGLVPHLLGVNL